MKKLSVCAFPLWSSHRFSSQSNGCLTLWYVNDGLCSVNGKRRSKKTKEYCFALISVLLWVRMKPSTWTMLSVQSFSVPVWMCVRACVCVSVSVGQSYCWAPRCLTACRLSFNFFGGRGPSTMPWRRAKRRSNPAAGRDDKTKQTWFFFSAISQVTKTTWLHSHLVFSHILPVPHSFLFEISHLFPFF